MEIVSKVILRHANLSTTQRYLGTLSDFEAMRRINNLSTKPRVSCQDGFPPMGMENSGYGFQSVSFRTLKKSRLMEDTQASTKRDSASLPSV